MRRSTRRALIPPFVTKDLSLVRELMHPSQHDARAQSLAEAIVPPGGDTILHRHALTEEVYHFTRGAGRMRLGDEEETFAVAAGDTVVIPPGTPHKLYNPNLAPLILLCACSPAYSHDDTELLEDVPDESARRDRDERRLEAFLREREVAGATLLRFERSCHSVAEAADAAGAAPEEFVKSVAMLALHPTHEELVVAVVKGEDRADPSAAARALGFDAEIRLARPEELRAYSGYPAGGLPPIGYDARFVVDERVLLRDEVLAGGGSDRALLRIAPRELVRTTGALVSNVRKPQ